MTKEYAIDWAKEQLEQTHSDGYVILGSTGYNYTGTRKITDYDFEVFGSYNELKNFIQGKTAYNFLDACTYLHDDEFIETAYSKSHIIVL